MSGMSTIAEGCFPFPAPVSQLECLLLLKILPTSSSHSANPPTGCCLCCTLPTHSPRPALWLRQGVDIGTTHKHALQGD
jgi:hypothetical protein